jgi:hypothetical protein
MYVSLYFVLFLPGKHSSRTWIGDKACDSKTHRMPGRRVGLSSIRITFGRMANITYCFFEVTLYFIDFNEYEFLVYMLQLQ